MTWWSAPESPGQQFTQGKQADSLDVSNPRTVEQIGNKPVPKQLGHQAEKNQPQQNADHTFPKKRLSVHDAFPLYIFIQSLQLLAQCKDCITLSRQQGINRNIAFFSDLAEALLLYFVQHKNFTLFSR